MGFEASDSGSQDSPQKCYYRAWCALAVLSFFACCCEITPAPWVFRGLILGAMTAQKSVRAASLSELFPLFFTFKFCCVFCCYVFVMSCFEKGWFATTKMQIRLLSSPLRPVLLDPLVQDIGVAKRHFSSFS